MSGRRQHRAVRVAWRVVVCGGGSGTAVWRPEWGSCATCAAACRVVGAHARARGGGGGEGVGHPSRPTALSTRESMPCHESHDTVARMTRVPSTGTTAHASRASHDMRAHTHARTHAPRQAISGYYGILCCAPALSDKPRECPANATFDVVNTVTTSGYLSGDSNNDGACATRVRHRRRRRAPAQAPAHAW